MNFDKLKKDIIKDLEKRKYVNRKVNYEEFLKLYEPYKTKIPEQAFARILGISKIYLTHLKGNSKTNAIVLKRIRVTQERKSEIEKELRIKGYSNSEITYDEFIELFSNYENEMIESSFAEILGMSAYSLRGLKSKPSKKIQILVTTKASEKVKHEIIEELKNEGYVNKSITYAEFLSLYEKYRTKISINEFSKVLSIDSPLYKLGLGKNKDRRIIILKTDKINEELKNDIIIELKSKRLC